MQSEFGGTSTVETRLMIKLRAGAHHLTSGLKRCAENQVDRSTLRNEAKRASIQRDGDAETLAKLPESSFRIRSMLGG